MVLSRKIKEKIVFEFYFRFCPTVRGEESARLRKREADMRKLADLVNVLEFLEFVTDLLQGEAYSTISCA